MKKAGSTAIFHNGWMILAVVLLVFAFLSINWYYYQRTRKNLDENFSFRLGVIATLVSSNLDLEDVHLREPGESQAPLSDALILMLQRLSAEYSLSNILVVREDGITLLTLQPGLFPPGEVYPHWNMDYTSIISALEGTPSATNLYRAPDGTYLKAGYAPMPADAKVAEAVVAVEASADFLKELHDLRAILLTATAVSIVGLCLFTWFVLKATGSLISARESLMQAETLASMGRMMAGIAHEIRNPLFIIRSSAERLKEIHPEDNDQIDSFIIEEVDRLNGTLTDYLLFARDEPAGRYPVDLVTILRRSVRLVKQSIEEGGIELATLYEIKEAPFLGEEKRLQQSFLNLLLNARQSIDKKGKITVSISSKGDHYTVRFEDTGSGMSEKQLQKVFEPFFTTKPAGSGLGLAIVKRIVEDHAGQVDIKSRRGVGTTVTVTLPLTVTMMGDSNEQDTHSR